MCDLANTETHSWSKNKRLSDCGVLSHNRDRNVTLYLQGSEVTVEKREKDCKSKKPGEKTGSSGQNKTVASTSKTWTTSHQSKC